MSLLHEKVQNPYQVEIVLLEAQKRLAKEEKLNLKNLNKSLRSADPQYFF